MTNNTLARVVSAAAALLLLLFSFANAAASEITKPVSTKRSPLAATCQNKNPPPAGAVCSVRSHITRPAVLKNTLASSATTYGECRDRCYSVNNCQSFSFSTPQPPQCTFYKKSARNMGWHENRRDPTIFTDRACLECNCNPTLQNGNWEYGNPSPWTLSGYDGYVTKVVAPGADGTGYALRSTPPLGNADVPGSSFISQQFAWCAFKNYTISFQYKMMARAYSTIEVYTGDLQHQTLIFSAGNDASRAYETVSIPFFSGSDNGWIQFQFDAYQVKQVFFVDNIVITLV